MINKALDDLIIALPGEDTAQDTYVQKLDKAIPAILARFQGKIDEQLFTEIIRLGGYYQALPMESRREILTHPYFYYWWLKLMERCVEKQREKIEGWLREFSRFLFVPCLKHGLWDGDAWSVAVNSHREVRFPGHQLFLTQSAWTPHTQLSIQRQDDELLLQGETSVDRISLISFLNAEADPQQPLGKRQVFAQGTAIEIDATDPWVEALFDSLNARPPMEGYPPRNLQGFATVSPQVAGYFSQALGLLAEVWPEFFAEMQAYTRLIVPFTSESYSTFTEGMFMGALFMGEARHTFDETLYTAEHLLHEHSHLRLTIFMEQNTLYQIQKAGLYHSPFRRDPRPVSGIFHGAFVFTRIARFMKLGWERLGDPMYQQRLTTVLTDLREAIEVLEAIEDVVYTPLGRDLMEQMKNELLA